MSRAFSVFAAVLLFALLFPIAQAAAGLTVVGASTKLCQLTGDVDWATNTPTAALTQTHSGLISVDLGFPVDSAPGPLYLLFGDAFPYSHPNGDPVAPDDAFGWTARTATPDASTCLDLQLATPAFGHPVVKPPIKQGSFNVPSGGVFVDDVFYAFFWTNHCVVPNPLQPLPTTPIRPPAFNPANPACLENAQLSSIGISAFARSTPAYPAAFAPTMKPPPFPLPKAGPQMPSGFVYVSAVKATVIAKVGPFQTPTKQEGVAIYGVPRYRASIPFLAFASTAKFGDPQTWVFFSGWSGGNPVWITRKQWESKHDAQGYWMPPAGAEIFDAGIKGQRCVGEHQVTWNAPLHVWLLLYNCGVDSIQARTAPEPWGPWSAPTKLIGRSDPGVYCTLLMSLPLCPGLFNYQWFLPTPLQLGAFYAPFVLNRYTQDATAGPGQPRRATIYWLLSTWNPYQVTVMQSTLEMTP